MWYAGDSDLETGFGDENAVLCWLESLSAEMKECLTGLRIESVMRGRDAEYTLRYWLRGVGCEVEDVTEADDVLFRAKKVYKLVVG